MSESSVFLVLLRRPRSLRTDPTEMRSDPYWEFGSFGITGCHARNLMNPKKAARLSGARLAFAQGGPLGFRLVYLTPPVRVVPYPYLIETTWQPHEMPLCYKDAPTLADNRAPANFPLLEASLRCGKRSTPEGQFASQFRSRATSIGPEIAEELIRIYSAMRGKASTSVIASTYVDALPSHPPNQDMNREQTYSLRLEEAKAGQAIPGLAAAYKANFKMNLEVIEEFSHADAEMDCVKQTHC